MASVMLEILDGFSSVWILMYRNSKSAILQVILNFEFWIYISSRHFNSNIAHHIVIHWSIFKV